ncbi:DNA damage-binding protein 1 [Hypsibius exemplaris]|uniref:DNA damage-binding protein 1 n=1 Tax=Hypsibius exemplaris TaxID=2072580 RepID=A0A9X6NQ75_HYPEX|nr:DNA damage-binding protein 1 [Hypsibius exemplaris]
MATKTNLPRFYVASSEPPGAAHACACGNFLRENERNLALARKDQLDIMGFTSDGLKVLATTRLAHAVHSLNPFRPAWSKTDLIFVLLHNLDMLILEFSVDSVTGQAYISTRANGSAVSKVGKLSDGGILVTVDPENRCIALHLYESLVLIILLGKENMRESREIETLNLRVDENFIRSITFLHNSELPTFALLYSDNSGVHVTSYEFCIRERDFKSPSGRQVAFQNLEADVQALVAVPGTNQGVLACGLTVLAYLDADGETKTAEVRKESRGLGIVFTMISDSNNTTKILVCDMDGNVHVIRLKKSQGKNGLNKVVELASICLGQLVIASCAAYLDNRVVFIGSRLAESSVIRFREEPHPETGNLFDVLETVTNIGCVTDFILVKPEAQGTQPQMIACSGYGPGTSARIIRSGIGVQETTSLDAPTGRQVFGLNSQSAAEGPHDLLVVSFLNETKVLKMEDEVGEFEDLEAVGAFVLDDATHLVAKVGGLIVQVTRKSIRAIRPGTLELVGEWFPSDRSYQIGTAAYYKNQVVVGAFDRLIIVSFLPGAPPSVQELKLDDQISAVDISSLSRGDLAEVIVAATWKMDLTLLSAPNWERAAVVDLNSDVFARSVMFYHLDNVDFVIAGLGDGTLQYFPVDKSKVKLGPSKRVTIATQPTYLKPFIARGVSSVFVCNDRPSVIHSSGGKLMFSSVNMKHIYAVCQLDTPTYPNSLAIITETGLVVGKIDEIQKLHIRAISLPGTGRRVVFQPETATYGFIVMEKPTATQYDVGGAGDGHGIDEEGFAKPDADAPMEEEAPDADLSAHYAMPAHKLLITDQTNYQIMAQFKFNKNEMSQAMVSGSLGSDPRVFYIVGTGVQKAEEKEMTSGRVIVFQYADKNLSIVSEKQMKSFTTCMKIFKDKLLMATGSSIKLMRWSEDGELVQDQVVNRFILPINFKIKGDFVLVLDLMRSVTLLVYRAAENKFDVIGEDPLPRWPLACEFVDDDIVSVADSDSNLIFLRRDLESSGTDIKDFVEVAGGNFADSISVIQKGTLLADTTAAERSFSQNALIMATQSGSIMHVLSIDENTYHILRQLSAKLINSILPFNKVSVEKYNATTSGPNKTTTKPSVGVINGDLIEVFTSMTGEEMLAAVAGVVDAQGADVTMEMVARLVEDLSRSH